MQHHISETVTPGTFLRRLDGPEIGIGDAVVIHSRGFYRTAEVTAIGPKRVRTEYVTRAGGTVTRPNVAHGEVFATCYGDDDLAGVVRMRGARSQYLED
jgi:hypothetical protein